MENMTIEAGLIIAALSLILGYLGYSLNKNKSIKDEGKQDAVISTKLDNIERGVQDIRIDIKANEKRVSDLSEKLVRIEESTKSAHRRIDKLEDQK